MPAPDPSKLESLPEDWTRAMAVVAHPDDLEYGSASAVARWTSQGKEVVYILVTRGEAGIDSMPPERAGPLREEEERQSALVVGVTTVEFLGYRDGVVEYGVPLRRDIARAIRRHHPEVLLTLNFRDSWGGHSWNTPDHRNTGVATLDASRDAGNRWIFPELLDEGLEPWGGVKMVLFNGSPEATHGVDVTNFLDKGIESLRKHEAYINALGTGFDPAAFLRSGAEATGARLGCPLAVGFEVVNV